MGIEGRKIRYGLRGYKVVQRNARHGYDENCLPTFKKFGTTKKSGVIFSLLWLGIGAITYLAYPMIFDEQPILAILLASSFGLLFLVGLISAFGNRNRLIMDYEGYETNGQRYTWDEVKSIRMEQQNLFWLFRKIPSSYNTRNFILIERQNERYASYQIVSDAEKRAVESFAVAYWMKSKKKK